MVKSLSLVLLLAVPVNALRYQRNGPEDTVFSNHGTVENEPIETSFAQIVGKKRSDSGSSWETNGSSSGWVDVTSKVGCPVEKTFGIEFKEDSTIVKSITKNSWATEYTELESFIGWRIVKLNNHYVKNQADFFKVKDYLDLDVIVVFTLEKPGKDGSPYVFDREARFPTSPPKNEPIGVNFFEPSAGRVKIGEVVLENSWATEHGLDKYIGHTILKINGKKISTVYQLYEAFSELDDVVLTLRSPDLEYRDARALAIVVGTNWSDATMFVGKLKREVNIFAPISRRALFLIWKFLTGEISDELEGTLAMISPTSSRCISSCEAFSLWNASLLARRSVYGDLKAIRRLCAQNPKGKVIVALDYIMKIVSDIFAKEDSKYKSIQLSTDVGRQFNDKILSLEGGVDAITEIGFTKPMNVDSYAFDASVSKNWLLSIWSVLTILTNQYGKLACPTTNCTSLLLSTSAVDDSQIIKPSSTAIIRTSSMPAIPTKIMLASDITKPKPMLEVPQEGPLLADEKMSKQSPPENLHDASLSYQAVTLSAEAVTIDCPVQGLKEWMVELKIENYYDKAVVWCNNEGACSILEIAENHETFADDLGLKNLERTRLAKSSSSHASKHSRITRLDLLKILQRNMTRKEYDQKHMTFHSQVSTSDEMQNVMKILEQFLDLEFFSSELQPTNDPDDGSSLASSLFPPSSRDPESTGYHVNAKGAWSFASDRLAPGEISTTKKTEHKNVLETHPEVSSGSEPNSAGTNHRIGEYHVMKVLGQGTFGKVFQVHDAKDAKYAIKQMQTGVGVTFQQAAQESSILQKLQHKHVIKCIEAFASVEKINLVFELCNGGDLRHFIKEQEKSDQFWNTSCISEWFIQIVSGVAFLHDHKIMHRDLKPSNIVIALPTETQDNLIMKIADFGFAKAIDGSKSSAGSRVGTELYMSPEMLNRKKYSFANDVWALGCILFELCTLKKAFECIEDVFSDRVAKNMKLFLKTSGNNKKLFPTDNAEEYKDWKRLSTLCTSMLEKDSKVRPSAQTLLTQLLTMRMSEQSGFIFFCSPKLFSSSPKQLEIDYTRWFKSAEDDDVVILKAFLAIDGIDVNKQNGFGQTAFNIAVDKNNIEIVKALLVVVQTDIHLQNEHNETAISSAKNKKYTGMVNILQNDLDSYQQLPSRLSALIRACDDDRAKDVKKHLHLPSSVDAFQECDVNQDNATGETALSMAARNNKVKVLSRLLFFRDLKVNQQDCHGKAALHLASANGHVLIVQHLLDQPKIDVNVSDNLGRTALYCASQAGQDQVVECLVNHPGIDANAVHIDSGKTALHIACQLGHERTVEHLISHPETDIHAKDKRGKTPGDRAGKNKEILKKLHEASERYAKAKDLRQFYEQCEKDLESTAAMYMSTVSQSMRKQPMATVFNGNLWAVGWNEQKELVAKANLKGAQRYPVSYNNNGYELVAKFMDDVDFNDYIFKAKVSSDCFRKGGSLPEELTWIANDSETFPHPIIWKRKHLITAPNGTSSSEISKTITATSQIAAPNTIGRRRPQQPSADAVIVTSAATQ